MARALARRFGPGERVAVWASNIPEWVVLEFGAALAGLTLVTVNPALRLSEARHVLSDSQAAGLFLIREYRGVSLERLAVNVRLEAPGLREVVFFDQWDEFLRGGGTEPAAADALLPEVQPGDPAQIQYTSGTTGPPKGAMLSHRGIVNNARLSYGRVLGLGRGDAFVNPMPLFHTAGCVLATLGPMTVLAAQVLVPYFDPALVLELTEAEHSFVFGEVPTMLVALLGHPDFLHTGDLAAMDDRGYSRIAGRLKEMIIRGGENIYPWEIEQVLAAHPDVIEVAVVGVPDPYWGEQVAAVVRLQEPAAGEVTDEELASFCRDRLARHKVPRIWHRTDALPLTGSGKVMKHVLRDQLSGDLRS